jgi:hypothetical protein
MATETQRIWKYELSLATQNKILMPRAAKILDVQVQADYICLWALVWPEAATEQRVFEVHGTGHPIQVPAGDYIATVQTDHGALVWHVFDVTEHWP